MLEISNFISCLLINTTYTCYIYDRYNPKFSSISSILINFLKITLCVSAYHISNHFNFHIKILMFFFSKSAFILKSYNLWNYIKIKYYLSYFSCSIDSHSPWLVKQNISTGVTSFTSYFSSNNFKSLASVAGLQLI